MDHVDTNSSKQILINSLDWLEKTHSLIQSKLLMKQFMKQHFIINIQWPLNNLGIYNLGES